jgi:D-alanine-D-alanine ligase
MADLSVIFGGPSLEHDVSILTGLQAAHVLSRGGQEAVCLYWSEANDWFRVPAELEAHAFLEGVPRGARPVSLELGGREPGFYEVRSFGRRERLDISAAVVCCHGGPGEDGRLQSLLDLIGLPYTGPGANCAALSMDKLAFTGIAQAAGLPALPRIIWTPASPEPSFAGPYIVKPRFGGSSLGVEAVDDAQTARDLTRTSTYLRRGAVLEPYKPDVEDVYIAIRTYPELQLSLLERPRPRAGHSQHSGQGPIYGYQQKYLEQQGAESAASEIPAQLPDEISKLAREMAAEIAQLTQLRGAARLDFLYNGTDIWVNELNSIPGALSFRLWNESGVSHLQLLTDLVAEASATHAVPRDIDPPDREAAARKLQTLQVASQIASKLI